MAAAAMRTVDTIYFGGGTPTTLSIEQFARMLDLCQLGSRSRRKRKLPPKPIPARSRWNI